MEFTGKSIIADWGNKRTYRVDDVDFEKTPTTYVQVLCTSTRKDLTVLPPDWDYVGINIHKVGEYLHVKCLSVHYPTTPIFSLQVVHSEEPKAVIQVKDLLLFLYEQ